MAVSNPPLAIQSGGESAELMRRFLRRACLNDTGVLHPGDLKVTQNGTPNLSVNVAAGEVLIAGTESSFQGVYYAENRSTLNLAIAAADATNPRKDLVVAKVEDAFYSGVTNAWSLAVVTGTPAPSPAEPAVPANALVLALVDVPALDTAITNSQITDRRVPGGPWSTGRGQVGYAEITTTSAGTTGDNIDVAGLSTTIQATAGRLYRITAQIAGHQSTVTGDDVQAYIVADGTGLAANGRQRINTANSATSGGSFTARYVPAASGAKVCKIQVGRVSGTGSVSLAASTTRITSILVEDIGGVVL